jgi:hypothetical protein
MSKPLGTILVAALLVVGANADIALERFATIDFSGELQGDNLTSVAWDGTNLYAATYTNTQQDVAITAADNALTTPTFRQFGNVPVTAFRGYGGLAINSQGQLAATVCSDGAASGANAMIFNAATGAMIASGPADATTNGGGGGPRTGPAWDPIKGGMVFTSFGSGRYRQIDTGGNALWTDGAGLFNFDGNWGTAWQDTDIDSAGNVYSREGQQIIKFTRTGADTFQTPFDISMILTGFEFGPADGDNNIGENLEVIEDFNALIWNDRAFTTSDQLAEDVIRAVDLDGNPMNINFINTPSDFLNNALFDFSYDAASQTLAVSEFSSNRVYLFNVTPEPTSLLLLGLAGMLVRRR